MEVLTLVDNLVYGQGLLGEHGLSFLIKANGKKILFDTGQTGVIVQNASYLEEDLSDVDAVVLSHGHYDHCGGLEAFLSVNPNAPIYLKRKAMDEKFSQSEGIKRFIGFSLLKPIEEYDNDFIFVSEDIEVFPGIHIISEISEYTHDLESKGQFFEKKETNYIQDPFADELFLIVKESHRNCIFTGCSHKGVLNILKTAYEKTNEKKIYALSGGMHFTGEILDQLDLHIDKLSTFGLEKIFLNHCTGIDGYLRLKTKFKNRVQYAFTGYRYEL